MVPLGTCRPVKVAPPSVLDGDEAQRAGRAGHPDVRVVRRRERAVGGGEGVHDLRGAGPGRPVDADVDRWLCAAGRLDDGAEHDVVPRHAEGHGRIDVVGKGVDLLGASARRGVAHDDPLLRRAVLRREVDPVVRRIEEELARWRPRGRLGVNVLPSRAVNTMEEAKCTEPSAASLILVLLASETPPGAEVPANGL